MSDKFNVFARCDSYADFTREEALQIIELSTSNNLTDKRIDKIRWMIYMKYKESGYIPGDIILELAAELGEDVIRVFNDVEF